MHPTKTMKQSIKCDTNKLTQRSAMIVCITKVVLVASFAKGFQVIKYYVMYPKYALLIIRLGASPKAFSREYRAQNLS